MIVSEKPHKNLSDYIPFLLKKNLHLILNGIISSEKMRNSGNYNCNYAHSFFGKEF